MTQRVDYDRVAPELVRALSNLNRSLEGGAIDPQLRYLVEIRVSQINGCAFCLDLHSRQARDAGEAQQRLDCLLAWREVALFSERERAALSWAESVTLVSQTHVPHETFAEAREHFSEAELVELTLIVISMNAWNRLAVSFRKVPAVRRP